MTVFPESELYSEFAQLLYRNARRPSAGAATRCIMRHTDERMIAAGDTFKLFLRYQTQAERHYRRAVEDYECLRALRLEAQMFAATTVPADRDPMARSLASQDFPNEPTGSAHLEELEAVYPLPNEPTGTPPPDPVRPSVPAPENRPDAPPAGAPSARKLNHTR